MKIIVNNIFQWFLSIVSQLWLLYENWKLITRNYSYDQWKSTENLLKIYWKSIENLLNILFHYIFSFIEKLNKIIENTKPWDFLENIISDRIHWNKKNFKLVWNLISISFKLLVCITMLQDLYTWTVTLYSTVYDYANIPHLLLTWNCP